MVLLGIVRNKEDRDMTKEKKTFAWDTILTMSLETDKLTVLDTDIEVKWCPITKMFWEK